jgi:Flp pilus assembly protein TadD
VLQWQPANAQAHNNLGVVLERQGNLLAASDSYRRATELKQDFAEAHHNLGAVLQQQGRDDQAIACWRRAVRLKPTLAAAHQNLGKVLAGQGRFDEAGAAWLAALAVQPDSAETLQNLAVVLAKQGRFDEAVVHLQRVVELRPEVAESFQRLSTELARAVRLDEAIAVQHRATQLHPDDVEAHHILAVLLLLTGRLAEGWPEYEWRWKRPEAQEPLLPQPRWAGEPLAGRTLLLLGEQGLGDTLQFIRYARHVKQQGAKVIVHVRRPLLRLVERMADIDQVISEDDALPPFDAHVAMMSLPGILGTTLDTIPAMIPYVHPDVAAVARWKTELASEPRYKVGIVWQGNPTQASDRDRSFPLACFNRIARLDGIRLYSLQFGAGREQLAALGPQSPILDLGDRLGDFLDTAAIMANLDLVIACDSAPAHLAGALGANVWLPLPLIPDWRWLLHRDDTPWYPTVRLFRQTRYADWTDVFERMERKLAAVVKGGRMKDER